MRPLLALALLLAAAPALAQPAAERTPSPAQLAQQQRMRDCNATAGSRNLRGEERQGFMRECLAGRVPEATQPAPAAPAPQQAQQERMRSCNAEAGQRSLAGDARRGFMRECLAGRMPPRG